jgi:hypothetical protein
MQAKKRGRDEFISDFKKLRGDQGIWAQGLWPEADDQDEMFHTA